MLKGVFFNLLGNSAGGLFLLAANLVLLNSLGASQFGEFSLLVILTVLTFNLISIGLEAATIHLVGSGQCHFLDARKHGIWFALIISVLAIPSIWLVAQMLFAANPSSMFSQSRMIFVWLILVVMAFSKLQHAIILGRSNFKIANLLTSIQQLFFLVSASALVVFDFISINAALMTYFAAYVVGLFLNLGYTLSQKTTDSTARLGFLTHSKLALSYGARVQAANLSAFLNYRADIIILNYFLDLSAVGVYRIVVDLVEKLWIFPASIGKALFSLEAGSGYDEQMTVRIRTAVHYSFYSTLTVVLVSLFLAPLLLPIASTEITPAGVQAFQFLLLGVLAGSISKVISMSFSARGRPGINSIQTLIIVALNVALNLILIPLLGMVGAAVATASAYVCLAAIKIWYSKFVFGSPVGNWWSLRIREYREQFVRLQKFIRK